MRMRTLSLMMKVASAPARKADVAESARRADFQGIPIIVDRPKGFVQTGTAPDGTTWERKFEFDNGFIDGTMGGDGEGLDVYLGPVADAPVSHWVTQRKRDGSFDEFKVMLGFEDQAAAVQGYLLHTPAEHLGGVCPVSMNVVKALLGIDPPTGLEKAMLSDAIAKARKRIVQLAIADLNARYPDETAQCLLALFKTAGVALEEQPDEEPLVMKAGLPDRVCKIANQVAEERYVLGIVLEPDVVDSQGDTYSSAEIEKTAHLYMMDYRNVGLQHKALVNNRVKVVESWLAKNDQQINGTNVPRGTWLMAVKIYDDELWAAVKSGELSGFSIAGFATRTPISS